MNYYVYLSHGTGSLLAIPAFIAGLMAAVQAEADASGDRQSKRGLALVGFLVGCVCLCLFLPVVVIALLLFLGPAIGNVFSQITRGLTVY